MTKIRKNHDQFDQPEKQTSRGINHFRVCCQPSIRILLAKNGKKIAGKPIIKPSI